VLRAVHVVEQSGAETGFSLTYSVLPCKYHSMAAPYSYIIQGKARGTFVATIP
jgi:hypothetical protein